jgi:hypothetical protein
LFYLCFDVDRPTSKAGFMADELYNQFKENNLTDDVIIAASDKIDYYKGKMNDNRITEIKEKCNQYWKDRFEYEKNNLNKDKTPIYLDSKSRERVQQCVHALNRNKNIQTLLHPIGIIENPISENEQAILLDVKIEIPEYKPFILKLKAKLDNYTIDIENNVICVNDIKTIGKLVSYFDDNFNKFHYYRELSLYSWLLSLCAKKFYNMENCTIKSNCLVVSTIPNYYTKVYELTKGDFSKGWNEFIYLLKLVAKYTAKEYKDFGIWI